MKTAVAKLKNLDVTPRKMRLVADIVRGMPVDVATAQLQLSNIRAAEKLLKVLKSAIANAKNINLDVNKLFIQKLIINQGFMLKRSLPRARGSASPLQKKFCHVEITLAEGTKGPQYSIYEKPKKVKVQKENQDKTKTKNKIEDTSTKATKKTGFMKKIFNRKAI